MSFLAGTGASSGKTANMHVLRCVCVYILLLLQSMRVFLA